MPEYREWPLTSSKNGARPAKAAHQGEVTGAIGGGDESIEILELTLETGDWMSTTHPRTGMPVNSPRQVLFASLIGTTIEFFDFYIYATAAVLVFPKLFFPGSDPAAATLESLATFGIAFLARPVGLCALRPLWRSHRPQDHPGHRAVDHGHIHRRHWSAADLPNHWLCRAAAAGAVPLWPGAWPGRRVGRGGPAGH